METRYLTVTALTKYIKTKLERDPHLQTVLLKGEISNFKQHERGHMYFTLKDAGAKLLAVMFAGYNRNLSFQPENGMTVLVKGEISLYEANGTYQMYVQEMQPDGLGNLYLAYEQLKARLEEEGLFSPRFKQPLPLYPTTIGVVTSPTGAAVRDIVTTIKRRYPIAKVIIFPALVQGEAAAASIATAIERANAFGYVDVLIVGRGGGSIEELWAFNEERVARAIFTSRIPIISAVGHETDFTIADFVADMRAPTPTAAAELAAPSVIELRERLQQQMLRLHRAMQGHLQRKQEKLHVLQKSYAFRYPKQLYVQKEEQLDRLLDRFQLARRRYIESKQGTLRELSFRLQKHHPATKLERARGELLALQRQLKREVDISLQTKTVTFTHAVEKLEALSPLRIMMRGYSLATDEQKRILKSVRQVQPEDTVTIQVQDGLINCQVRGIEERDVRDGKEREL